MGKYINGELVKQFEIHIYMVLDPQVVVKKEDARDLAMMCAMSWWDNEDVYKVKVWDLRKGPVEPNNPNAVGLIKEYI